MEKYQIEGVPMEVYTKFKEKVKSPIELQLFRDSIWEDDDKTLEENIEATKEYHLLHILQAIIYSRYAEMRSYVAGTLYCMSGFAEQEGRLPTIDDDIRVIKGRWWFDIEGGYITSEVGFEIVRKSKKKFSLPDPFITIK